MCRRHDFTLHNIRDYKNPLDIQSVHYIYNILLLNDCLQIIFSAFYNIGMLFLYNIWEKNTMKPMITGQKKAA